MDCSAQPFSGYLLLFFWLPSRKKARSPVRFPPFPWTLFVSTEALGVPVKGGGAFGILGDVSLSFSPD